MKAFYKSLILLTINFVDLDLADNKELDLADNKFFLQELDLADNKFC
jgi:hypothetical protein